jgi:hypothetical protein
MTLASTATVGPRLCAHQAGGAPVRAQPARPVAERQPSFSLAPEQHARAHVTGPARQARACRRDPPCRALLPMELRRDPAYVISSTK